MRLIGLCEMTMNESLNEEMGFLEPTYFKYLRRINGTWEYEIWQ